MYRYQVFGGSLSSELAFPELDLDQGRSRPDWSLKRVTALDDEGCEATHEWRELGSSPVEDGVASTLFRRVADGAMRLVYDDTGTFEIAPGGASIRWCPPAEVDEVRARKDVLGRVFALVFHLAGIVTLHGSAVAVCGRGLCFLAPKFHGKSTTAAALVDAGATLLADDLVVIAPGIGSGGEPHLLPTLSTVHLWPDAAARVGRRAEAVDGPDPGAKVQLSYAQLSVRPSRSPSVPLSGVYLLAPVADTEGGVERVPLPPTTGAMALLGQLKVGDLLGAEAVLDLLPRMAALAERVGIYRLEVPRDLQRLPELVAQLSDWHGAGERSS